MPAAGLIIDEAQRFPDLFSYPQRVVDERRAGPFVLTASQQFLLAEQVDQSPVGEGPRPLCRTLRPVPD